MFHPDGKVKQKIILLLIATLISGKGVHAAGDRGAVIAVEGRVTYRFNEKDKKEKIVKLNKSLKNGNILTLDPGSMVRILIPGGKSLEFRGPRQSIILKIPSGFSFGELADAEANRLKSGISPEIGGTRIGKDDPFSLLFPRGKFRTRSIFFRWKIAESFRSSIQLKKLKITGGGVAWERDISSLKEDGFVAQIDELRSGVKYNVTIFYERDGRMTDRQKSFKLLEKSDENRLEDNLRKINDLSIESYKKSYLRSLLFNRFQLYYESYLSYKKFQSMHSR